MDFQNGNVINTGFWIDFSKYLSGTDSKDECILKTLLFGTHIKRQILHSKRTINLENAQNYGVAWATFSKKLQQW